jgi:hypothetical protein
MVKYGRHSYPHNIPLSIEEVAGHFDKDYIRPALPYSLHTEYSHGARRMNSLHIQRYSTLRSSTFDGIPMLWSSEKWVTEFSNFIFDLTNNSSPPEVIEIHPPFTDYCPSFTQFLDYFSIFEALIKSRFPKTQILIENRCGTLYKQSSFLLSSIDSLLELSKQIDNCNASLSITLDIPQLYTAHNIRGYNTNLITEMLTQLMEIRHNIHGIHLWGKQKQVSRYNRPYRKTHTGDLNTYFKGNQLLKQAFIKTLFSMLDDDIPRFLVLEVNSDLLSIVNDLQQYGFTFV